MSTCQLFQICFYIYLHHYSSWNLFWHMATFPQIFRFYPISCLYLLSRGCLLSYVSPCIYKSLCACFFLSFLRLVPYCFVALYFNILAISAAPSQINTGSTESPYQCGLQNTMELDALLLTTLLPHPSRTSEHP